MCYLQMFNIYLIRAAESFGVTNTREIYERAIEVLPDQGARYMECMYVDSILYFLG